MNEYRKRIAALRIGDPVIVRPRSGGQWYKATVTATCDRSYAVIEAGGLPFSSYGSAVFDDGRTSGCRCIVPVDMWESDTWKPGALPPPPAKVADPCVDCKGAKTSLFSPRCPECRQAHAAKKKIEYKKNRKEREVRYLKWQMELLT